MRQPSIATESHEMRLFGLLLPLEAPRHNESVALPGEKTHICQNRADVGHQPKELYAVYYGTP